MSDFKISNESCQFKPKISTNLRDLSFICWQVWVSIDFFFLQWHCYCAFCISQCQGNKNVDALYIWKENVQKQISIDIFFRVSSKCYLITHFCTKRLVQIQKFADYNIICHSLHRTLTIIWNADPVHNLVIFTSTICSGIKLMTAL